MRILIADDSGYMRACIETVLRTEYPEATYEHAKAGDVARDAARRLLPDLIVSDVRMPGLDGFGLVDALRNDPRLSGPTCAIPIVLCTSFALVPESQIAEMRRRAKVLGVPIVAKPKAEDPAPLLAAVHAAQASRASALPLRRSA